MKPWLVDALAAWGINPRKAHADKYQRALRILLPDPSSPERRMWVGTLAREGGEFVFRYSDVFKRANLPPVFDFPDMEREYRSPTLWPFFEVRLPPTDRPDVEAIVRDRHIDTSDTLKVLAELGKKAITSPYVLELYEPARA